MKIIQNTYKHVEREFEIKVIVCGKMTAIVTNLETGVFTKLHRGEFEQMIQEGIFIKVV